MTKIIFHEPDFFKPTLHSQVFTEMRQKKSQLEDSIHKDVKRKEQMKEPRVSANKTRNVSFGCFFLQFF